MDLGGGRPSKPVCRTALSAACCPRFLLVQHPGLTLMLYELLNYYRQIFTDYRTGLTTCNFWYGYQIATGKRIRS
jgi:hypothetical protein